MTDLGEQLHAVHAALPTPTPSLSQWLPAFLDAAPLPLPGAGRTLHRWQAFAQIGARDLAAAKLFEAHHDALAILAELGVQRPPGSPFWAVWAAEPPGQRVRALADGPGGAVRLQGSKPWCSGAGLVSHALLTTWDADGGGPWLVLVNMAAPGISHSAQAWHAVGMERCTTSQVTFDQTPARIVGACSAYVSRAGFMQGGAGVAACWYGGAVALADALRSAAAQSGPQASAFRLAALGRVDVALAQTMSLLREAAAWIDAHPAADASVMAWRVRESADLCAGTVLDEVGRALGAGPFCADAAFARMAADLPVFVRQSLAERDMQALGKRIALGSVHNWQLVQ